MTSNLVRVAVAAVAAGIFSLSASAQSADWRVDSNHSSASLAFKADPGSNAGIVSLGTAAASGILRVDGNHPANSSFQFDLAPARSGSEPSAEDPANSTHITFRSESASVTPDGKLKLTGTLTVSRVIRDLQLDGNEGYSGPVETGRIVFQSSRQQTLLIPIPSASQNGRTNAYADLSTTLKISDEEFPELVDEALTTTWPAKAADVSCESSATSGEDYSGTLCTGTAVQSRSANRTAVAASEGYDAGEPVNSGRPNIITLALHFRLAQQNQQLSVKAGQ